MNQSAETKASPKPHMVNAAQLPASCPPRGSAVISLHPRVYLKFNAEGQAKCPYCGARFLLEK